MAKIEDFQTKCQPTWCPGCGNYSILTALKKAFLRLGFAPYDVVIFYGIGCHGHMVNYLKTYGFQGLHGRALPLAAGARLANHKLNVLTIVGDGDQLGEGGNHLIHAARANYNICCIVHNNGVYGLTVGQSSPTSPQGFKSSSSPLGTLESPLDPLALAIVSGATFAARGFAGEVEHLSEIFVRGIKHQGFALIEVLQPCVIFNYVNTYSWYQQRVYKIEENYNPKNKQLALKKVLEKKEKIPLGILYEERRPIFEEQLPQLKEKPLAEQSIKKISIEKTLKEFR